MTSSIFFVQTGDPVIQLPETGEERVLLNLEIPKCYKHNSFKVDSFFELNFLLAGATPLHAVEPGPFKIALEYQLLDGLGENCNEITSRLEETISGTVIVGAENKNIDPVQFESNTTPNLTAVCEQLQESFYLVASVREIQGVAFLPTVQFRSLNAYTVRL
ncbi:hypothetical protein [Chengkuizengella sediminis]|uniref:hypothetical protein n=1 Tax=Chengkuizengella sediminis TaxID=1885917 RepID=UPI0013895AC6|nr:hypothetical protein [Chengkuizengella sediminis]NDI33291.1 hypothetical protein [Chengkuizengella sediminis]